MKHLFVSTLFATLLFIMAQACSGDKVVLTKEHNGNKVALKSDDALVVQLPGNPTTGYSWSEKAVAGDAIVQAEKPVYEASSGNLVGGGGVYTFHYKAAKSGEAKLTFILGRSWESQPIETYEVTVSVQ